MLSRITQDLTGLHEASKPNALCMRAVVSSTSRSRRPVRSPVTFPIVKGKDKAKYGEYRTKRMILEKYEEVAPLAE